MTSAAAAAAGPPLLPATAAAASVGGSGGDGQEATRAARAAAQAAQAVQAAQPATHGRAAGDPFDLVQMKYVSSIADVVAFAACLHLLESEGEGDGQGDGPPGSSSTIPRRPAAVVVDGLSSLPPDEASAAASTFDRRSVEHAVLRALAVLSDATAGAWRRKVRSKGKGHGERGGGGGGGGGEGKGGGEGGESSSSPPPPPLPPIALVVAEEAAPDGRAPFYLYRRWLPLVLAVRPAQHEGGLLLGSPHRSLLSLAPLPAAAGGACVSHASASAAAMYSFEGAGELEALGVAV